MEEDAAEHYRSHECRLIHDSDSLCTINEEVPQTRFHAKMLVSKS